MPETIKKNPEATQNKAEDVEQQPTNQQALQILDSCASRAPLNRQAHFQVQQASQQLSRELQELEKLKERMDNGQKQ